MYDCNLIVPAYNEETKIHAFLCESEKYQLNYIFVSDGTDETTHILREYIHTRYTPGKPSVTLLTSPARLGKGGAIKQGVEYIKNNQQNNAPTYVGYIDVDLSTQITELVKMFDSLKNSKCDAVIGTRWSPGSLIITPQPLHRRLMSRMLNILVRMWFDLDITDTQCGAKVFKSATLYKTISSVKSNGFEFDVELLWKMHKNGDTICEFPVIWRNYTKDSKVKIGSAVEMFINLIKLKFFT